MFSNFVLLRRYWCNIIKLDNSWKHKSTMKEKVHLKRSLSPNAYALWVGLDHRGRNLCLGRWNRRLCWLLCTDIISHCINLSWFHSAVVCWAFKPLSPRLAIILTLLITMVLYVLLMITAVLSLPPADISASEVPLAYLYQHNSGQPEILIMIIGMFAVVKGALIQMIMASRLLYGLSSRGQLPSPLNIVHQGTQTPLIATSIATVLVMLLALFGSLLSLPETTSVMMLTIFSIVNLSLWRIKRQNPYPQNTVTSCLGPHH